MIPYRKTRQPSACEVVGRNGPSLDWLTPAMKRLTRGASVPKPLAYLDEIKPNPKHTKGGALERAPSEAIGSLKQRHPQ
jgi:hypothetical protein